MKFFLMFFPIVFIFIGCSFKEQVGNYKNQMTMPTHYYVTKTAETLKIKTPYKMSMGSHMEGEIVNAYNEKNDLYMDFKFSHLKSLKQEIEIPSNLNGLFSYNKKAMCDEPMTVALMEKGMRVIVIINRGDEDELSILFNQESCREDYDRVNNIFYEKYNKYGFDLFGNRLTGS